MACLGKNYSRNIWHFSFYSLEIFLGVCTAVQLPIGSNIFKVHKLMFWEYSKFGRCEKCLRCNGILFIKAEAVIKSPNFSVTNISLRWK